MRHLFISIFCFALSFPAISHAQAVLGVDSFTNNTVGDYPKGWRTWPTQGGKAREVYKIAAEGGNKYLAAQDDKDHSVQIFREFGWDIQSHPVVTWRWRAKTLPRGADERSSATNDSACGVYVIFGKTAGKGLKYVWSSALPAGATHTKEPGKMYFTALAGGAAGAWRTQKINVIADYKKFFGEAPTKNPVGIGILTDGNATHSPAACDYDDFAIAKE